MVAPEARSMLADDAEYPGADEALREFSEATPTIEIPAETMASLVYPTHGDDA